MSKTLGELAEEVELNDREFTMFVKGFDLASELDGKAKSTYSAAMIPWLWGHYTNQLDET